MAGASVGLGGALAGAIGTGAELGIGPTRLLVSLGLTMALFLVVVTGAELFTGNNLMLMGLFSRRVSLLALTRNKVLVYAGNLVGTFFVERRDGRAGPLVHPSARPANRRRPTRPKRGLGWEALVGFSRRAARPGLSGRQRWLVGTAPGTGDSPHRLRCACRAEYKPKSV